MARIAGGASLVRKVRLAGVVFLVSRTKLEDGALNHRSLVCRARLVGAG